MKKETLLLIILAIFLLLVAALSIRKMSQNQKQTAEPITQNNINYQTEKEQIMPASLSANKQMQKPAMIIDQNKTYQATLHTNVGDIVIALNAQATPITVNNFVYLAQNNFFDGTIFHRVIKDFMIQGGDPRGDGTGGPGYQFADEDFQGEYTRGAVAMANAGPDTNGSQFFIMQADYPLQPNYVIFGQVISGMEVVDQIANAPVQNSFSGEMSKPVEPITVKTVEVRAD